MKKIIFTIFVLFVWIDTGLAHLNFAPDPKGFDAVRENIQYGLKMLKL